LQQDQWVASSDDPQFDKECLPTGRLPRHHHTNAPRGLAVAH